ncbi:hypothetical protein Dimus_003499 [Dionaea muscipula]
MSLFTGQIMHREIKVDVVQKKSLKKISGLKEENIEADVEMVTQENNALERRNEEMQVEMKGLNSEKKNIQIGLEKEKGERKKADDELIRLTSKLDGLRSTQIELRSHWI